MSKRVTLSILGCMAVLSASFMAPASTGNIKLHASTTAPQPVVAAKPKIAIGWHGKRYWDGHRYWTRRQWKKRLPPVVRR